MKETSKPAGLQLWEERGRKACANRPAWLKVGNDLEDQWSKGNSKDGLAQSVMLKAMQVMGERRICIGPYAVEKKDECGSNNEKITIVIGGGDVIYDSSIDDSGVCDCLNLTLAAFSLWAIVQTPLPSIDSAINETISKHDAKWKDALGN